MEFLLASCQCQSVFSFCFLLQSSWALSIWMLECDLWPWPLIPDLVMMVVNWWEAKGRAHLCCCDLSRDDVSCFLVKHFEA